MRTIPGAFLLVIALSASIHAADTIKEPPAPMRKVESNGPLAGLPSAPGPHLEKIKALGDNEWLDLGAPAPDPKWGKARGRAWSSNIPFAPELKGAFLCGEGVHAFVKPDGHFMDDLWFYDVNAHRWICLYPGNEVKSLAQRIKDKELTLDERGLLVDKDGQPMPGDMLHAWGLMSYDPDQRKLAYFGGQFGCYFANGKGGVFEEASRLYGDLRQGRKFPALSPFLYDVPSGKFECYATNAGPTSLRALFCNLVYVNSLKQFFWGGGDGVYYFNTGQHKWSNANPKGSAPTTYDNGACYDAKRNRIYYGANGLYGYDIASNAWSKLDARGAGPRTFSAAFTSFYFDTVNDKAVAIQYDDNDHAKSGIFIYDPEANAWSDPLPIPKSLACTGRIAGSGFYDPELNAFFFHAAGDSVDNGRMWVYRYKKSVR